MYPMIMQSILKDQDFQKKVFILREKLVKHLINNAQKPTKSILPATKFIIKTPK